MAKQQCDPKPFTNTVCCRLCFYSGFLSAWSGEGVTVQDKTGQEGDSNRAAARKFGSPIYRILDRPVSETVMKRRRHWLPYPYPILFAKSLSVSRFFPCYRYSSLMLFFTEFFPFAKVRTCSCYRRRRQRFFFPLLDWRWLRLTLAVTFRYIPAEAEKQVEKNANG